ncbi:AAA family ATPase [Natronosporangium hydrolyticum]|uniref:AAA family ATPase n=1 Tax=Natronosporangium hydrolyticum TaxID=2811111 RepID=A0A895Y6F6_9ACTN|nr:UvrD-helicase domain-containing protein [Natronosporangium hydrolyticum]QSB13337.1 AAA family ATPase [Natronosporangium hydrolyticum]
MTSQTTLSREIATEQRYLDRVYARLAQLRAAAEGAERDGYRLAGVGNYGALVERDAMVFHAAKRRAALDAEHEGLVFGRLDRRDGSVQYVGRLGIRDHDTTPLVIDWRAPAAADFYQATAADPRDVVRRRMIRSRGETVTGVDDDLLDPSADVPVVGDGALLASLNRATATGMRDIVATIQREQDAAIRSPASGVTLVEGGPGTGKTAVALHRAAYLLYRDRSRFAGGGILVVGPSPVFIGYIATVLPSLGEHSATLKSLGDLVPGVSAGRLDPAPVATVKGSLRMLTVLRRAAREQLPDAPTELRLTWRGRLLRVDAAMLERIRRRALPRGRRRNEVRRAAFDGVFDALWQDLLDQQPAPDRPRPEFEEELSDRSDFRDFLRAWWPLLRPAQVLGSLADRRRLARLGSGVLSSAEVTALAESFGELAERGPTVADVALLDELDQLLGQPPRPKRRRRDPYQVAPGVSEVTTYADRRAAARTAERERPADYRDYAHVVVDEAQDVSPMQWRMLGRRGRSASWTVVGDPAQTAWNGDEAELARARDGALRGRRDEHTLTTNYRNSKEIFELAAGVIRTVAPTAPLPTPVRSTGVPPEELLTSPASLDATIATAVDALLEQVEGTVGVITPLGSRERVADGLAERPASDGRVQVVTSLEAKGMEYDAVVLVEPHTISAQSGVRTLYVALSRATQRLTVVATEPWRE